MAYIDTKEDFKRLCEFFLAFVVIGLGGALIILGATLTVIHVAVKFVKACM